MGCAPALLALFLWAPKAAAAVPEETPPAAGPHVAVDIGPLLGSGNSTRQPEPILGLGLHLTVRPGPVVLVASMETATNFLSSGHLFLTVGAGYAWPLSDNWKFAALGLFGVHDFSTFSLLDDTQQDHDLRVLGVRVTGERSFARWVFPRIFMTGAAYVDLQREHDLNANGNVGGVTVLLGGGFGLGI
jgi:hypothetical protein